MSDENPLFYVLIRNNRTKETQIARYYDGLSVFEYVTAAQRRVHTLENEMTDTYEFRILPWRQEGGKVDLVEMWGSAVGAESLPHE